MTPLLWEQGFDFAANWNVTPTTTIPVLLLRDNQRMLSGMRWGIVPGWATAKSQPLINARMETVAEKPSFRDLLGTNQCVIIMDGYYEWKKEGNLRRPYFIQRSDGHLLLAAGLWQANVEGAQNPQVTMITRPPIPQLANIHNRMPYLLTREAIELWCGGNDLCEPTDTLGFQLETTAVSPKVNSVNASGPECVEPSEEQLELF